MYKNNTWKYFEENRPWMEVRYLEIFKKVTFPAYKLHIHILIEANNVMITNYRNNTHITNASGQ